ncbi:zinc-ribbon domain-containing protein [Candidatus Bathyarchaeota archaeon]|nr:zinc-ribbon domain-containing protein [Candidatus Bathyarchaeota archaeon]
MPTRKELAVWISGYLTFLSILFTFDAFFFFGGPNSLMKLYPIYTVVHGILGDINAATYIWLTSISTFILFGITCAFLCEDPFTHLIKKMASEAQLEENQIDGSFQSNLNTLEMINHSLTHHSIDLNEVKKNLHNLKDKIEAVDIGIARLTAKLASMERETTMRMECASCGNKILPEFKLCPYCGKELSVYKNIPALIR